MEELENINIPETPVTRRKRDCLLRERPFLNCGLKLALGLGVVLIFLTAVQCSIKKPESPQWTTDMTVPVVNRTYNMQDIIDEINEDEAYLALNDQGAPVFSYTDEIDTVYVSDNLENLSTADVAYHTGEVLGEVTINPDNPAPVSIDLADHVTLILEAIPPASFDIIDTIPSLGTFSQATIASGSFDLILTNDFGVDLDTVIISLYDLAGSNLIYTETLLPPGIPDGEIDTVTIDLTGKTISDELELRLHCHTPGAGPTFSLADKSLSAAVEIGSGLTVSSAVTEVPRLIRTFSEQVPLDEDNLIESAVLESGQLDFTVTNGTSLDAEFDITFDDFTRGGNPLVITRTVAAGSTEPIGVDLADYTFAPLDQVQPQDISIDVSVVIDSTAPDMVAIDENDSLSVDADVSDLSFSSITGTFQTVEADLDPISLDLDLPKGFDEVQLVGAVLTLEVENTINVPGSLFVDVLGSNGKTLNIVGEISGGVTDSLQVTDLSDFLSPIPTGINVTGRASFGHGASGTINAADYALSTVTIAAPLQVIIPDSVNFEGDVSSEEIDQEDIDIITDHVTTATLVSTVTNHLPVGVEVMIYIDGNEANVTGLDAATPPTAQQIIGPFTVAPGTVADHIVSEAAVSENSNSVDIAILENETLYIGTLITLLGTDGQSVLLTAGDFVSVQGVINVEYFFDGEF